jgi:phosphate transport system substrate-binding protein
VNELVQFYLKNAPALVKEVGYVPLARQHYDMALRNFTTKKLGTGFGGKSEVGVKIDELLARKAAL